MKTLLDWLLNVIIIITFFVIAYRIKIILQMIKLFVKAYFQEHKLHIKCPDCKSEYDINPIEYKEFVCPKCKEIIK